MLYRMAKQSIAANSGQPWAQKIDLYCHPLKDCAVHGGPQIPIPVSIPVPNIVPMLPEYDSN